MDSCVSNHHRLSFEKLWLIKLQKDGRSYNSIHTIRGVVRPAFQMTVDDDLIRKNPFGFQLATVVVNDSVTREAITRKQERAFLEFVKNDKHFSKYYDGIFCDHVNHSAISGFCTGAYTCFLQHIFLNKLEDSHFTAIGYDPIKEIPLDQFFLLPQGKIIPFSRRKCRLC